MNRRMHRHIDGPAAASRWIAGALIGGLIAVAWQRVAEVRRHRLRDTPRALPDSVQVWEDEGGRNQMPDQPR